MTTPQQPPPQQQQAPPPDAAADAAAVALIAGALVAVSAAAAFALIWSRLRAQRLNSAATMAALEIVMAMPPEMTGIMGSASLITNRTNTLRRAQFALAAARRLTQDILQARSRGQNVAQALTAGVTRERRYFGQHIEAMWQRAKAGAAVDQAAWSYGDLLGWYTVKDNRTSAECLAADGKNFYAAEPPLIGYPGAVHPHCRCYPGPAHVGGRMLPSVRQPERVLVRAG